MSRKRKYETWIEPNGTPADGRVAEILATVVLNHAILDDVTCPSVGEVPRDEYVKDLANRLRSPIAEVIKQAGLQIREEELPGICRGAAGEVLVIRGLCELLMDDEIAIDDIRHLPFFKTYRDYFEQTPEIVNRAIQIAISIAGASAEPSDPRKKGNRDSDIEIG